MNHTEFCDLIAGVSDQLILDYLHIQPVTLRRWKTGKTQPPHSATLALRMLLKCALDTLGGPDWAGFTFGQGKLYLPGWRGGFDPHQIRGMFFKVQLVAHLESQTRALQARINELEQDLAAETDRAERYRGLVQQESRWGLLLGRMGS